MLGEIDYYAQNVFRVAWTGTPSASTSTLTSRNSVVRTNLFINPDAAVNNSEWFGYYFPFIDRVTTEKNLGVAAIKVTTAGNTTPEGVILYSANGLNNTTYTVSVWAKGPVGLVLRISGRTESPQQEHIASQDFTMTGAWLRMHTTYTTSGGPFGLLGLQTITTAPLPAIGTIFYLTDAMIEKTNQLRPNFNTSTASASSDLSLSLSDYKRLFLLKATGLPATRSLGDLEAAYFTPDKHAWLVAATGGSFALSVADLEALLFSPYATLSATPLI